MSEAKVMIKHLLTIEDALKSKIAALENKINHDGLAEYLQLQKKIDAKINNALHRKFKNTQELEAHYNEIKKDNIYLGKLKKQVKNHIKNLQKWYDEKSELQWELSVISRNRSSYEYYYK